MSEVTGSLADDLATMRFRFDKEGEPDQFFAVLDAQANCDEIKILQSYTRKSGNRVVTVPTKRALLSDTYPSDFVKGGGSGGRFPENVVFSCELGSKCIKFDYPTSNAVARSNAVGFVVDNEKLKSDLVLRFSQLQALCK